MEGTGRDHLLETLDDLRKDDLKRFKHKLRVIQMEEGYQAIPWGRLEKGDPVDVTDLLISHCGERYGVEVAVKVLRDIRQRQLAERLSRAGSINAGRESETKSDSEPGRKDGSNRCEESAIGQDPETELSQERRAFHDILSKLNLEQHRSRKLRLSNLQEISADSIEIWAPHTLGDLPWHFLRKVMALSGMARNTSLGHQAPDEGISEDEEELESGDNIFQHSGPGTTDSLHPLDVLCAVLLSSDSFLQQEILSKMSMCQFALPLLLPALDTPKCTLLLWAMRDIVRKWRPHSLAESRGFREESLVLTSMPTISFVRLGSCSFSKSKLLNEVLSPSQQHHDFFIHRDMESGNVPREIADGLVEISWYFPGGKENSDLFPEPVAVANLRGDIESHQLQFSFLTEISSAVFIVTESINKRQCTLLSSLQGSATKYYFILSALADKHSESLEELAKLAPVLKLDKSHVLENVNTRTSVQLVKKLQSTIGIIMMSANKSISIAAMAVTARKLGIQVDEDYEQCQSTSNWAKEITSEIQDVAKYKKEMLRLQGDIWKKWVKLEKELCRMNREASIETQESHLREKVLELRSKLNQCDISVGTMKFITGIEKLSKVEVHSFLKWMRFNLENVSRGNKKLSLMENKYKEEYKTGSNDPKSLSELDELFSASSLRVEHFMRELGQFYETECTKVKEGIKANWQRRFIHLPDIAADLMVEGFPVELIDGDSSNIPLQWVTDVLTQLHTKLGGRSRMLVLTVLGVQSTGKSTLLNTMFGLQFAVSSGRCTRGAFMSFVKVAENFQQELGCDFILVIDTEGLKAPEMPTLEDSYEHDNELATLVIGLSDITIVNMAMSNATEMQDILQIVVHTFLRMREVRHKPYCQFVHQNIKDVSAHEQNTRDMNHLLEQLNEITKAVGRMEKQCREIKISDMMDYDPQKYNWYIPRLWHGVPPMAPVNIGYSESVCELKKYLFKRIRNSSLSSPPKDIPHFIEWVRSLWNAVKHESFSFSFKKSLVAEAYNQMSVKFEEWELKLRELMAFWVTSMANIIQSQTPDKVDFGILQCNVQDHLVFAEQNILDCLGKYFDIGEEHLMEKYKEDFIRRTSSLKQELERYAINKLEESIYIRKYWLKVGFLKEEYMKTIEENLDRLWRDCRRRQQKLDNRELESQFEIMWRKMLSELPFAFSQECAITQEMMFQLTKDLSNRAAVDILTSVSMKTLLNCETKSFPMKQQYLDVPCFKALIPWFTQECYHRLEALAKSLMAKCISYTEAKVRSKAGYDETCFRELLNMVNEWLQEEDVRKLPTTLSFETDLKFHILWKAAYAFQKMNKDFIKGNDPQQHVEQLKPQYLSIFKYLYLEKDSCENRVQDFCDRCLKPALKDYVNNRLGMEIADDFLSRGKSTEYSSRSVFHFTVQKKLLEEMNFDNYVEYINNYEKFVKSWMWRCLLDNYYQSEGLQDLEKEILSTIIKKIRDALEMTKDKKTRTVCAFLFHFCEMIQKDLVIPSYSLVGVWALNTTDTESFFACIQSFLPDLEQQILAEFQDLEVESKFSSLSVKPQDEIFKRVFGCGKQCPFCKVPCEADGRHHREHFASVHRPQSLQRFGNSHAKKLHYSLCSTDVLYNDKFQNSDTEWKPHPYKDYRDCYPDWYIQPDPSIVASDYWKFVFKEFNHQFAREYDALPADLPEDWGKITEEQALESIKKSVYDEIAQLVRKSV
ncbi:up-regulator of cell proliferation-like [Mauremys reevesii]|uniref:up-regulator of cell proliferation-like n=1 Tax=Mauremys reevesii TaxID=260615 RepID=UPI0019401020|nr:up-regulator of cell proliferation-like [Mauremys reevesii]XP_039389820.1 up-regulator of cell proliferation-like [Mauremys reevesii]